MNTTTVLDNLQKIIDSAEILAAHIPEDAFDDLWIHESIDNALGELERTSAYLKDKYDLDVFLNTDDEDDFLDADSDDFDPEFNEFDFEPYMDDDDN